MDFKEKMAKTKVRKGFCTQVGVKQCGAPRQRQQQGKGNSKRKGNKEKATTREKSTTRTKVRRRAKATKRQRQ